MVDFPSYISLHNKFLAVVSGAGEEEMVYGFRGSVSALQAVGGVTSLEAVEVFVEWGVTRS